MPSKLQSKMSRPVGVSSDGRAAQMDLGSYLCSAVHLNPLIFLVQVTITAELAMPNHTLEIKSLLLYKVFVQYDFIRSFTCLY